MPALGGLTMRARWPLPIGLTRLTRRWLRFLGSDSRLISSSGWIGGLVAEMGATTGRIRVHAVDRVDPEEAPVLLGLARRADGARDAVADPQPEAADLAGADVDVLGAGQEAVAAHEAEALVDHVEDPGGVVVAGALGLALEDPVDEVVAALAGGRRDIEVETDGAELLLGHLPQVGDVQIVPLSGGLDLLELLGLGDRRTTGDGRSTTRTAITGTIALVGTDGRHMGRTHEGIGRGRRSARNRSAAQAVWERNQG